MKAAGHVDPNLGSALSISRIYFSGLETLAKGYEPALKAVGRWNLELLALTSRRSQAWLGVPARFSQCKSPADVAREQLQFWQSAASDYSEAAQRLGAAFAACAVVPEFKGIAQQRDFITVEEPTTSPGKRSDRKAA
jgi:hypothetical protein